MEDLVARAREADARLAEVREGAVPAGDPDPYRDPPGRADLDDDDDPDDDPDDGPEGAAPGTRPAGDLLGGTSATGDRGAGYSPP
jgi:ribosome-binding factor A